MAASGGTPQRLTQSDAARKESAHLAPQFLPDGKRFLYFITSADPSIQGIYAGSLDNPGERVRILATDRKAYYVPARDGRTGFLLWLREQTLLAQPFDPERLRLEGTPKPLVEEVVIAASPWPSAAFWASEAGLLVYRTGGSIDHGEVSLEEPDRQVAGRSRERKHAMARSGFPLTASGWPWVVGKMMRTQISGYSRGRAT